MFDAAYLRLTAWYVAIVMAISLLFSVWVYTQARRELNYGLKDVMISGQRFIDVTPGAGSASTYVSDRLADSQQRLKMRLIGLNIIVLVLGATASYFLARRTMRPIEEAVEAQHRFTADASHELRTPLTAMKTEIEVGMRDTKLTKDDAVELLRSNLEEIDRLGHLTEGLLALTQADLPVEAYPISLEELAGKVAKRLQPLADAKHIGIRRELHPVIVQADEASVDKIVGILLDNAIKYSSEHTAIALKTYRKDGNGFLAITDHGIGIKATELPHVFDRFYRADTSRSKTHANGYGLGLSIALKLAEHFDGTILATSRPGEGSTFTVKLPVAG